MYWIIIFIILLPLSIFGEDIITNNGKVYKNVQIFKQEADRLIVTCSGGAATIYLKDCPEDIQRKYQYNITDADIAKSEREKKLQAAQKQLERDQKIQLEIWKKQQAAKEQQKTTVAKVENERLIKAQRQDRQQEINTAERGVDNVKKQATNDGRQDIVDAQNARRRAAVAKRQSDNAAAKFQTDVDAALATAPVKSQAADVQNKVYNPNEIPITASREQRLELQKRGQYVPAGFQTNPETGQQEFTRGGWFNQGRTAPESQQLKQTIQQEIRNAEQKRQSNYLP